jgi:hypothetical protein
MAVDKVVVGALATALMKAVDAAKDGVGFDDMDEAFGVITALKAALAEAQADKVGFALILGARLAEAAYDERGV